MAIMKKGLVTVLVVKYTILYVFHENEHNGMRYVLCSFSVFVLFNISRVTNVAKSIMETVYKLHYKMYN